uniref:amidase family protein n=1 Tax=Streptomyces rhizosphaericus TaxID=114699 RepID=UPI001FCA31CB
GAGPVAAGVIHRSMPSRSMAATGPAPYGLESTGNSVMSLPWSYAGAPALALPAGRAANSLPLGVQCVARPGADERLLGWAPDVESVLVGTSAPV